MNARLHIEMKNNQKGFSLIELLIVVVIVGILTAIAIPNLIAIRRAANEGSAIATVKLLYNAQVSYSLGNGRYGSLTDLRSIASIDETVASGMKSGYTFNIIPENSPNSSGNPSTFVVDAVPSNATAGITQSGTRRFCFALGGSLRADTSNIGLPVNSSADCNYGYTLQ